MVVKTYYDDIINFDYSNSTISFETPFTWDAAYVAQVPVLHMEIQFPKTIRELQTNSYRGMINGMELEAQAVVIDDYTSVQNRIVHFIVNNAMLSRLAEKIQESNVATFTLKPSDKPKFPLDITSLPGEKFLFQLSWGPDRKSTRLNSSHRTISYAVFCLKKKIKKKLRRGTTILANYTWSHSISDL